jgi:CheY-like chemotaxis protein
MARILIADDNQEILRLVSRVLASEGYDIEAVQDGATAIEKINADGFDAILLDFMMPLASGLEVIDWIEENRPEVAKACVIVMTAAVSELRKFDTTKVFAAIAKPFDIFALRDTVRRCIENRPEDV